MSQDIVEGEQIGLCRLIGGNCLDIMKTLEDESFDALISDPPYAINLMERRWDNFSSPGAFQAWCQEWATQAMRLLRPGGHLLCFGSTRTYHRLACGIEDAGFELRDMIEWFYGTGWSKAHDASKIMDAFILFGKSDSKAIHQANEARTGKQRLRASTQNRGVMGERRGARIIRDEPATPEGKQWQGWATALKPAHEPIAVARRPIEGRLPENLLRHGNGALNIDATKIPSPEGSGGLARWPANVAIDGTMAALLDEVAGKGGVGPSSFFYCPKPSTAERNAGLDSPNRHDTVKPIDLMRWLCRMVVRPGARILDPFAGTGTTGIAANFEKIHSVLIEKHEPSLLQAAQRLRYWENRSDLSR